MKTLSPRQEQILLSLKKLDFLSRDQLNIIHHLKSVRNTNRILGELSPYLSSFREEYATIYYLNREGREYVDSKKIRKKTNFVRHIIMRNDYYIYSGMPHDWTNETRIKDSKYTVICDAWYNKNGFYNFLEVDCLQKMRENKAKIERYKGLFSQREIANHIGHFPSLIWLTTTEFRKKQLKELCEGLSCSIYTVDDIR